jgi:paraquat-inducible protein B
VEGLDQKPVARTLKYETKMFKTDSDMLIVNSNVKLEMETVKRCQDLSFVREEKQEKIEVVNRKSNSLISGGFESLELQMSETKQSPREISKKLHN